MKFGSLTLGNGHLLCRGPQKDCQKVLKETIIQKWGWAPKRISGTEGAGEGGSTKDFRFPKNTPAPPHIVNDHFLSKDI